MDHETIIGIDLGTTNSEVAVIRDGEPVVLARRRRRPDLAVGRRTGPAGPSARRQSRTQPVRPGSRADDPFDQAEDGPGGDGHAGRPEVHAAGDLGHHPADAQGPGREGAGPPGLEGGHHGPGLLQRRPAAGHTRGRRAGRSGGRPDHQRADRRGADLRPPPHRHGAAAGLRPGRRHVRRLAGPGRERRRRDPGQPRRYPARRRRLRPVAPRPHLRRVRQGARRRPPGFARLQGPGAPRRRGRQEAALLRRGDHRRGGVHRREGWAAAEPEDGDHPLRIRRADPAAAPEDADQPRPGTFRWQGAGQPDRQGDPGRRGDPHAPGPSSCWRIGSAGRSTARSSPTWPWPWVRLSRGG